MGNTLKVVRVYDEPDGWVEYTEHKGIIFASAHTVSGKYSMGMLRAMIKNMKIKKRIVTELRYNYLIEFYKKHFEVTDIGDNLYIIEEL